MESGYGSPGKEEVEGEASSGNAIGKRADEREREISREMRWK